MLTHESIQLGDLLKLFNNDNQVRVMYRGKNKEELKDGIKQRFVKQIIPANKYVIVTLEDK